MNVHEKQEFLEEHMLSLAKHFGLKNVIVGLHNASVYGEIFKVSGDDLLDGGDETLKEWFKHIDALIEIVQ